MAAPAEPLLPPEEEPRSRMRLVLLGGGLGLAGILVATAVFLRRPSPPEESPGPSEARPRRATEGPPRPGPRPATGAPAPWGGPQEKSAEALFQAAQAFERAHPGDHERIAAEYRRVLLQYPT